MENNQMNGFFNCLKPTGVTSSDVVCRIKKIIHSKRVGHLGTIDQAGSGVLPIAVGKATKLFDFFLKKDKKYFAIFRFGVETSTLDSNGEVVDRRDSIILKSEIDKALSFFVGNIKQTPPSYSAIKIGGKRASDHAIKNESIQIVERDQTIFSFKVVDCLSENEFSFLIHCSSGTYIRSLARDLAKKLGTVATMTAIIRIASGPFDILSANTLKEIEENTSHCFTPITEVLKEFKKIELDSSFYEKLRNGVKLSQDDIKLEIEGNFLLFCKNEFFGIFELENKKLKCMVNLHE